MTKNSQDERFPVWDALSEFFLDTELQKSDIERISNVLANSPYSIQELKEILYFEVYPACKWNFFSVAGEWAGFHPDWIVENIAPRKDKRPKFSLGPFHKWMFRDHWTAVSDLVEKQRDQNKNC